MVHRICDALRTALAKPAHVEIPANVERIQRIPYSLLPDMSAARDDLLGLAWAGKDVDAYIPVASTEWVIWCRPEQRDQDGRYSIEEWKAVHEREYYRLLPIAPRSAEEDF